MDFQELIWRESWLAPIALNIKGIVATESVKAMGVTPDGRNLYYNPSFWNGLKAPEKLALQIHTLLHIANRHQERRGARDRDLWNMACDISINYLIKQAGYTLPSGAVKGDFRSAEAIYDTLEKLEHDKNKHGTSSYGQPSQKDDSSNGDSRNNGSQNENLSNDDPMSGDLLERNADGSASFDDLQTMAAVQNAAVMASKQAGRGTTSLSKLFKPLEAKADWRIVLRQYVKSSTGDNFDYLTYEFDEFGICEDILAPKPAARICALVDESGSISDRCYSQFLGELRGMSRFADVYASGFTDGTDLREVPISKYKRTMSGGTDMLPAYYQACERDRKYDCIIVLTDGHLEFPEREPVPTMWVMPESFSRKQEVILY